MLFITFCLFLSIASTAQHPDGATIRNLNNAEPEAILKGDTGKTIPANVIKDCSTQP